MSTVKISDLPAATSISLSDTVPIVQSGTTKKATFSLLNIVSVKDGSDPTKVETFDVSNVSTATTRTLSFPNSDTKVPIASQFLTFTGPTQARTYTLPDAAASLAPLTSPTFVTPTLGAATATSLTLTNGGALTDGGTGALNLTASGTNQNITLTPSGSTTGGVLIAAVNANTPTLRFGSDTAGWMRNSSNQWSWGEAVNNPRISFIQGNLRCDINQLITWTAGNSTASSDTGIWRNAAGVIEVNNGTAISGTTNAGAIKALTFLPVGTAATCTGATIGAGSKSNAGFVTATTTGTSTVVMTLPVTAPTGWSIMATNISTGVNMTQSATSQTTATFTGATTSGNVVQYIAMPY